MNGECFVPSASDGILPEFWNIVLNHCTGIDLLDHRRRCADMVDRYNREIEREKKRDFVGEW